MLGTLLPGLRDVRAPLAAGALLLLSGYLLLFDSATSVFEEDSVSPALRSVYDLLGRTGLLMAAGVTAYLVGTVLTRFVMLRMRMRDVGLVPGLVAESYLSVDRKQKPRAQAFQAPFSRPALRRISTLCDERGVSAETVLGEIVLSGGKRLLVKNRDLYVDYDRLQSEAEFRFALLLPALLLSVAMVLQVPATVVVEVGAVVLVTTICFFVVGDAFAIRREANSMYAHMVADGLVSTPSLDAGTRSSPAPKTPEAD